MSFTDKVFSGAMLVKILSKVNSKQRRFLINIVRQHFEGKETNFGNAIAELSFNEYANNLVLDSEK